MKFGISEVTFSPTVPAPVTYDTWRQATQRLTPCTQLRQIQWLYSLVSVQGDRSVCIYQIPYADAVREAYHEAEMPFQRVWQAELWLEQDPSNFPQGCSLIIAEVKYDPPMTKAIYESGRQQVEGCFQELDMQHIFSAVSPDGTHSVCVFSAASAEDVRSLYRKIGQPFQQVWKATLIRSTPAEFAL
ncbi:DUF4242 domain-containing protein [Cyanobacteria bacterium FACHB-63]|nr:DUF4242 domain-containing protein [Cyanobacteria bacterium FACHB-63]